MLAKIRKNINALPRVWKRIILVCFDFAALLAVLWVAYSLRLSTRFLPTTTQLMLMLLAPMIAIPIFIRMGLYRAVIRYLPERAVWTILQAMTLATLLWVALVYLTQLSGIVGVPRSIPVLYWAIGVVVVAGSRFAAKRFLVDPNATGPLKTKVLVYGAGDAGVQLANALQAHGGRRVSGFIDDNPTIQGHDVAGITVHPPEQIGRLIANQGIKEVILSLPSIAPVRRQAIYTELSAFDVIIRALPSITDLATGRYLINQVREIDIDDLLGRSSVPPSPELIGSMIKDQTILVSGAGGSIGSELARLIAHSQPQKLILFEANEHALYQIDRELRKAGAFEQVPVLGSVCNRQLLDSVLNMHGVDTIFHAAAHKHVPLVEANVAEGVRNNVLGTKSIANAAYKFGVKNFVLISTDKAVHPTSVMGATKRWAEYIVRHYGLLAAENETGQRFSAVRFGNVLGSNGSVVPLFKEQIDKGGPITLTDEAMTRYFMSIHEAAELIIQAGALSKGDDIFLLEMGLPVRIRDLAENMVRLAGLTLRTPENPTGDIAITITGKRPGEKLTEELLYEPDLATPTRQPKILRAKRTGQNTDPRSVEAELIKLSAALDHGDADEIRQNLFAFVSDAKQ